jgi:hypothetical protein
MCEDVLDLYDKRNESVEATVSHLTCLELLSVLRETSGVWELTDHPDLATPEDVNHWLTQLRLTR